jgi:rhodanese-related sulfurtransferase
MITQIDAKGAWKIMQEKQASILIDVRTKEEIDFVGFVDLSEIDGNYIHLLWKNYPTMSVNDNFTDELEMLIKKTLPNSNSREINLLFLCRSGNRSLESAMLTHDLGYNCYNIKNGFEGDIDELYHRGNINGWKAQGLPWRQN